MSGHARGGNDYLSGGAGDDTLSGDGGMSDNARGGDDYLEGGAGDDQLTGDGYMSGNTRGGNDRLFGGAGDDTLYGDGSVMGKDTQGGDDCLRGGSGHDIFGFAGGDEFTPGDGRLAMMSFWIFIKAKTGLNSTGLTPFKASPTSRSSSMATIP